MENKTSILVSRECISKLNLSKLYSDLSGKSCIIRHNDLDGATSAAIVIYNLEKRGIKFEDIDCFSSDYNTDWKTIQFDKYDNIFIVDFSMHNGHVEILRDTVQENAAIIWIDHHTTSNRQSGNVADITNNYSIFIHSEIGVSAAAMVWMWFIKFNTDNELSTEIKIPEFIQNVSYYDTFSPKMSLPFFYGISACNYEVETKDGYAFIKNYIFSSNIDTIIKWGEIIKRYLDIDNRRKINDQAIRISLEIDRNDDHIDDYCIAAINRNSNSLVFGDDIMNKYDAVIVYWQRSDLKWQHSIFIGTKETESYITCINCSDIAEKFYGGGRRECAGFTLNDNIVNIIKTNGSIQNVNTNVYEWFYDDMHFYITKDQHKHPITEIV